MNRNLLVIHLVLVAAASRKPDEESWLVQARQLDADEVGRRADELARSRLANAHDSNVSGTGADPMTRPLAWS
jgi:hypothetical protein